MPRDIDFSELDKINQILGGGISTPLQKQGVVHVEDTPLVEGDPGIQSFNVKETDLGNAARKNYNMLLQENYNDLDKLDKDAADTKKAACRHKIKSISKG
jgi:hypothetical protein